MRGRENLIDDFYKGLINNYSYIIIQKFSNFLLAECKGCDFYFFLCTIAYARHITIILVYN